MMNKSKRFDCVAMKDEIQQRLLAEWRGKADAAVVQRIRADLRRSTSTMGTWWRRLETKGAKDVDKLVASSSVAGSLSRAI